MTTATPRRSTQARGFLFADLRGYTAFVEARGNEAAAELLRTYRGLVRSVIAHFDGAEIRTEGDSFYVVFPSASDAVLAGLAILGEAAAATEPIRVGVGVHAGEATETDEGYVGWAVNVAARVCAAAGAGELFVTDIVRGLTRGHSDFTFESRGRRRLKGVAEPVPLYAVRAAGSLPAALSRRRAVARGLSRVRLDRLVVPALLAVGVLVLTAAAIAFLGGDLGGTAREAPSTPAASVVPSAVMTPAPATPGSDAAADREAANERLRSRIDDDVARHCTAADPEDAPTLYLLDPEPPRPLVTLAGLRCDLGGGSAPDIVSYWLAEREEVLQNRRPDSALFAFFSTAGQRNISPGDCATETRAWSRWEFGGSSGNVLCSRFGGEALLMWTHEGTTIIAQATREDGDSERLYRWWEDHARTLGPEPSS